jgi:hypothetical protein
MRKKSIPTILLAVLLMVSSMLATIEYSNVLSVRSELNENERLLNQPNSEIDQLSDAESEMNKLNDAINQRDTLVMELDTALNLSQSRLNLKLPDACQYLTTLPSANNETSLTKIFLESTAAWYYYRPAYPFNISWFNETTHYGSSQQMVSLTDNRSIPLSLWGWTIGDSGNYEYGMRSGSPYLTIGVTVRNDYTAADIGNDSDSNSPIGNSDPYYASVHNLTASYLSFVHLAVKLVSQNGTIIPADSPGIQSPRTRGDDYFMLGSGETKQVVFYLSPSSLDIDSFTIYVSYISSVPPQLAQP